MNMYGVNMYGVNKLIMNMFVVNMHVDYVHVCCWHKIYLKIGIFCFFLGKNGIFGIFPDTRLLGTYTISCIYRFSLIHV